MKPTILPDSFLRRLNRSEREKLGKVGRTNAEIAAHIEYKHEKNLQRDISGLLAQRDIWCNWSKMHKPATNRPGTPDFLFVLRRIGSISYAIALEAKIGKAEPSNEQLRCHEQMRRNGWLVYVVRSLEEVQKILDE